RAGPPRPRPAARTSGSAATPARSDSPSGPPRRAAPAPPPAAARRRRPGRRTSISPTRSSTAGTPGRAAGPGPLTLPEVVRERDVQPADQAGVRGPQFGPQVALDVLVEHLAHPVAQLLELGRRDVQQPVAEHGRPLPLGRLAGAGLEPARQLLEVLLGDDRAQQAGRRGRLWRVVPGRVPDRRRRGRPPRLLPSGPALG